MWQPLAPFPSAREFVQYPSQTPFPSCSSPFWMELAHCPTWWGSLLSDLQPGSSSYLFSSPGKLFLPWGQGENHHHHLPLKHKGYFQRMVMSLAHSILSYTLLFSLFYYFYTLLIHHCAPCHHDLTCKPPHLLVHDTHLFSIRLASLIWWTHDLQFTHFTFLYLVTSCTPTMAQPIMNHHATQSGTYYTFTLDEPCAHLLAYHSYITCLYLLYCPEFYQIEVSPRYQI